MRDLPTGLVTFLLTDIEGSTRLVATLGPRYLDVHATHQRLVRAAIVEHGGLELSTEGDSFFMVFASAPDAIVAAAAMQRSLAAEPWPPDGVVRIRIGIHTGQGIRGGDNYLGLDVHRAARIASAAAGGQVLVSEPTRHAVAAALPAGVTLRDLGRHRLRDVGVEHLWQLDIDGLPSAFPRPRTLEVHPSNLPLETSELVDREPERERVRDLLARGPLVTLTGPAGIGKSRVAILVAAQLVPEIADGVFYVDAANAETADVLADALVRLVGAATAPGDLIVDALMDHLRDRTLLLVLDNVDRVKGAGQLCGRIAGLCPSVRLLVTTRSPLRAAGEREVPLGPLALTAEDGQPAPAVALFLARARAVRPDFALTPANAAAIEAICARVDGVPLAIELAAARIRVLSPDAILTRLDRQLALLTGGAADAPDRQRTLRAAIDWSVRLVGDADQRALARLSVFAGAFDLPAASAVGAADAHGDSLDVVGRLVDQSLVVALPGEGEPRFRLLAPIREFAADALAAAGDTTGTRRALAAFLLSAVDEWAPLLEGPRDLEAVARLEALIDDIRAALDWLAGPEGDPATAVALSGGMGRFWYLRGRAREGRAALERALATAETAQVDVRDTTLAEALTWAGVLADEEHHAGDATRRLTQALDVRRRLDDRRGMARVLNSLGVAARSVGDLDRAQALLEESLALRLAGGDPADAAITVSNLGIVASDRDDFAAARDRFAEALALERRRGNHAAVAYSLLNLGGAQIWLGEIEAGVGHVREALPVFVELDDTEVVAEALELLGDAALALGKGPVAARLLLVAEALRERAGTPLRPVDLRRVEPAMTAALAAIDRETEARLRAEAAAHDLASAAELGRTAELSVQDAAARR